ncbi:Glucosamine-6-phosphate isomerase (Glucosamine-6-phosphate deaminase) (GNPDA) (GlcN6P deaminase) [Coemansia guatemalensis]|uniref:beta-N-acetylhexosaminidase n=1 Tax=Coemansia guatemalensis TaxID=2761395 RepID=A0A9W8LRQ6_9FUNG|nr:Glucosamine-6-phosphate isomerase (Glucosamine-6-phosphate deaminase) (GNPDA) (GlcN6P deaminase) [Coemansia guatemalensis]
MAWVWPLPRVFETGNDTTAAPQPTIIANYATSALLSDAVKRYNDLISREAFTPPADYNRGKPNTSGNLSKLQVKVASSDETLSLETDESYTLDVPVSGEATLSANTVYGAIRGLESFSQLFMSYEGTRVVRNTPVHIEDKPVLAHRGIMLDTARNYYPVKDIKRTLDAMSYNKLNVLHWHIVDSQSWPVESKTYPDLQKNGAYGADMQYSYADVKDIIQYAKGRGIRVIPEFDMPGHMFIVGETYPGIMSCMNKQPNWDQYAAEPPSGQLNIADPAATEFAVGVINEYTKLFTDEVFNLGGDEVNRKCWEEDSKVKEYLSKNANATVETLLAEFYTQVHAAVKKQKKVGMSWEETLFHSEYTPPKDTIIQTWIDEQSIPKTVAKGYRSIASPSSSYYLDCGHGSWLTNYDGNSWCDPFKTWMHIYNFDPFANVTDSEQRKLIVGAEVALWSEQSDTVTLDKYLWPRAAAMAETAWTGKANADGHVRTTAEVTQRMHDQRFRMVGRGIGAEPLQPLCFEDLIDESQTMSSGGHRTNEFRRGHSNGSNGGGSNELGGSSSSMANISLESLTDEQRRTLRRRIETLKGLEQGIIKATAGWGKAEDVEIEELSEDHVRKTCRRLGVDGSVSINALSVFGKEGDWRQVGAEAAEQFGRAPQLTWEMLKKAVAEEDKYQSKKNWSSTKGRGNRKAPVARRLDAEALKKLGVYPLLQFVTLSQCDTCGRQVNAQYLKEHQEINCEVPLAKREDKRAAVQRAKEKEDRDTQKATKNTKDAVSAGVKRQAGEMDDSDEPDGQPAKAVKITKKERLRLEKERREKERLERKEKQRLEKERKKREREEKREREQAKARLPLDLDKQCGVVSEPGASPCTRSLTCKTHSMAMKRGVRGRSNMFDALLQAHLAKSRSAAAAKNAASRNAAAKSSNAAAVRNATAIALGGGDGALDESFFEESDQDRGSDSEAEMVIDGIKCSRGRPMAVRMSTLPRRRHHYLRVRDLFYDALRPSVGSDAPDALATS